MYPKRGANATKDPLGDKGVDNPSRMPLGPRSRAVAIIALLCALSSPAGAEAGEIVVGAHADRSTPPRGETSWANGAWAELGLGDTWAVLISVFVASHELEPPETLHVTGVSAGFRYTIDVLEVMPFLDFGAGALIERVEKSAVDPQLATSVGVDWIFWRHGSVGVAAHWNQALPSGAGYFRLGPRLALRWP